jgi:hypothetical protein
MRRRFGRLLGALGTVLAALMGDDLVAAGPIGSEFRVNTSTSGVQIGPAIVTAPGGHSVVTWEGAGSQTGQVDSLGVFGQRLDAAGTKIGSEFRVNTTTSGEQAGGDVDMDAAGRFVVVWEGNGTQTGQVDSLGVFGQRFDAGGNKIGTEFRVNTFTTGDQAGPGIAMAPDGSFVVAWESDGQDGNGFGVYAQRFNSDGTRSGGEFRVNSFTIGEQAGPALVADSGGEFIIVWESFGPDGNGFGVVAQRFDAAGPVGGEILVNTHAVGDQAGADIDLDANGNPIIVWESFGQDSSGTMGAYGQRFDATGAKVGPEFRINAVVAGDQAGPDVDIDGNGDFVVAWESYGQDGGGAGVYAQRYLADGTKNGSEFRVNATTSGDQLGPGLDTDTNGNLLVVWEGNGTQTGHADNPGTFAQRFDFAAPDTTITSGPSGPGQTTSATFTFSATEAGATFACLLDTGGFSVCTSPKTYTGLSPGGHTFQVKATDAAGNTDLTPALRTWGVLDQTKPSIALRTPAPGRLYVADAQVAEQSGYTIVVGSLTLKAEASDAESGIESFVFEVDGVALSPATDSVNPQTGVHTYTLLWHWGPVPGQHAVRAFATNGAGMLAGVAQAVIAVGD